MLSNVISAIQRWLDRVFPAQHGWALWAYLVGSVLLCVGAFFAMQRLKPRGRKQLIAAVTFLGGLYYALEFFLPIHVTPDGSEENALTQFLQPVNDFTLIITSIALGLGIYSLCMVHGKTLFRAKKGWFNSLTFFAAMIAMAFTSLLAWLPVHKDVEINKQLRDILYVGGLQALEGTMFSVIAFYIASAAFRAFRVRNVEASLLMGSAFIVMLGQVYAGQVLTAWIPADGLAGNLRVEVWSDWLLTRVNAPAVRAVGFGLGVGLLATSLRIWLSLERGSYFDREV